MRARDSWLAHPLPQYSANVKIVVVGGAGEVGKEVTRELARSDEVGELVVADLHQQRAHQLVESLAAPHVSAVGLDVRDGEAALEVLAGADVLMNCTSFVLYDHVIELARRARVDYADLISEPTPAQRTRVEQAGVTAISGLGATPGLSNVLVRHASEELDLLEEVHISWVSLRTIAPTPGALATLLWELSDECPTRQYFQSGRYERAAALEGSRLVRFAEPVSTQRVYYVPHTEVKTLPRHFPGLRYCAVRGTWRPELMEDARVLNKYGLLSGTALESTKARIWEHFGGQRDHAAWALFVNVELIGSQDGHTVRRVYDASHPLDWGQDGMARMTGICAAVGAQLLARHGRGEAGFVDPEIYFDPHEFLDELGRRGGVALDWSDSQVNGAVLERPAV